MPNEYHHPIAALAQSLLASEEAAERRTEARYPTQDPAELEILPGPSEPIYGTNPTFPAPDCGSPFPSVSTEASR